MKKLNLGALSTTGPTGESESCLSCRWIEDLIEHRASEKDGELKNELLKQLVLRYSTAERQLAELNRALLEKQRRLDEDLRAAAEIQKSLLPHRLPHLNNWDVAWKFVPCDLIGGDIFNVLGLDEDHMAVFMLDVSGHGIPAAMVAVSVFQTLQSHRRHIVKGAAVRASQLTPATPREVLEALDREFPLERFDKFFTITYLLLSHSEGTVRFSNAGHPPPLLLRPDSPLELLDSGGTVIGMDGIVPFEEGEVVLRKGDRIILYTDGLTEYQDPTTQAFFGRERLHRVIETLKAESLTTLVDAVHEAVTAFGGYAPVQDDFSLMAIEYRGRQGGTALLQ